jgi:pheromone shutdown protein TraB
LPDLNKAISKSVKRLYGSTALSITCVFCVPSVTLTAFGFEAAVVFSALAGFIWGLTAFFTAAAFLAGATALSAAFAFTAVFYFTGFSTGNEI